MVQQGAEDAGRVEAGGAEPVDGAVGADQRRRLQVSDQTVIGNQRVLRNGTPILNAWI
jgi:hypothetical protein